MRLLFKLHELLIRLVVGKRPVIMNVLLDDSAGVNIAVLGDGLFMYNHDSNRDVYRIIRIPRRRVKS